MERGPFDGCWEWCGATTASGYGVSASGWTAGSRLVHRRVYEAIYGPFDPALSVCHRCDNPPCFRPDHLFLGTAADNIADMVTKGRHSRAAAKLTMAQAEEVRDLFRSGALWGEIAEVVGVPITVVRRVLNGTSYGGPDLASPFMAGVRAALDIRDARIVQARLGGASYAQIMAQSGESKANVQRILQRHGLVQRRVA